MRRGVVLIGLLAALLVAGAPAAGAVTQLAYVKGGGANNVVWLADANGKHGVRLGRGDLPLLAPAGNAVAASLYGPKGPALVLYRTGRPAAKFFDLRRVSATAVSWSPDSRYLALEINSQLVKGTAATTGLAILDTQTDSATMIDHGFICGASFAPDLPDRIVYGRGPVDSFCLKRVDLFTSMADGSARQQLTHNRRSLNPIWGSRSIAFDRQRTRGKEDAPVYQVWTMQPDGTQLTQVTHLRVPRLLEGLAPIGVSAGGRRLLAAYYGQDTREAWTVRVGPRKVKRLTVHHQDVYGSAISRDGRQVLVEAGPPDQPPSHGNVVVLPFSGGHPKVLVRHAGEPSWNR